MTTGMLVESLMNGTNSYGGFGSGVGYDVLTESEAASYTLESGAALIARESRAELHEIFEMAIIQTNEAIVGAKLEGYGDVMESATYGPVFEEAEKTVGRRILDFLIRLKDKILAFFKNLFTKLSEMTHNYDKFLEKNGKDLDAASAMTLNCIVWNDDTIDKASEMITDNFDKTLSDATSKAQKMLDEVIRVGGDSGDLMGTVKSFEQDLAKGPMSLLASIGLSGNADDMTSLNEKLQYLFRQKDKKKQNVTPATVRARLTNVKKQTEALRKAQKKINDGFKDAIKQVKRMSENVEKSQKKGCSQFLNRYAASLSKQQQIMTAYVSASIRATVSRANEAQAMAKALISGNAGKFDAD